MKKLLSVKLSNTMYDAIHTHAVQNDLTVAQVVRHAIRAHINYVEPTPNIVSTPERPRELSPRKPMTEEQKRQFEEDWNY
jgi:predicted DNA-binding protein